MIGPNLCLSRPVMLTDCSIAVLQSEFPEARNPAGFEALSAELVHVSPKLSVDVQ